MNDYLLNRIYTIYHKSNFTYQGPTAPSKVTLIDYHLQLFIIKVECEIHYISISVYLYLVYISISCLYLSILYIYIVCTYLSMSFFCISIDIIISLFVYLNRTCVLICVNHVCLYLSILCLSIPKHFLYFDFLIKDLNNIQEYISRTPSSRSGRENGGVITVHTTIGPRRQNV